MAVSDESAVKEVKESEKALKDHVAVLELKMRTLDIKFWGLPEHSEIHDNLVTFMMSWITSFLQPTGGTSSTIRQHTGWEQPPRLNLIFPGMSWCSFSPLKIKMLC